MTQAFLPFLKKSTKNPRVINISSGLGSMSSSPRFSTTSYQCSKAAVNMLTKCFAYDAKDIIFVAMHPGWVQTDMGSAKNRKGEIEKKMRLAHQFLDQTHFFLVRRQKS